MKFPDISPEIINSDISATYAQLWEILKKPQIKEAYSRKAEANFREKATELRIPIEGSIELTYKCNLQCVHCYCVNCDWPKKELTTAQWNKNIDAMAKNGCVWLLITGGEPLARRDFSEIFLYAKKKGMIITLFTNALLIKEHHCLLFKQSPPHLLEITVYGMTDETYYRVTGDKRGFSRLVASLDLMDKHGIEYSLKSTIVNDNFEEIEQMMNFARGRNTNFRQDARIIPRLDGVNVPDGISVSRENVIKVEFIDNFEKSVELWESTKNDRSKYFSDNLFFCNAGKVMFNIDPFGEMSVCGRIRNPSVSLLDENFEAAWEFLKKFAQQPLPSDFKCQSCYNLEYCKPCPVASFLTVEEIESQFCQFTRLRAEIIRTNKK